MRPSRGGARHGILELEPTTDADRAAASAVVLTGLALLVLARAGLLGDAALAASTPWAWAAVVVSLLTTLANTTSRSRSERAVFLPGALGMLATSLIALLA